MAAFGTDPPRGSGTSESPSGLAGAVGLGHDPWAAVCAQDLIGLQSESADEASSTSCCEREAHTVILARSAVY